MVGSIIAASPKSKGDASVGSGALQRQESRVSQSRVQFVPPDSSAQPAPASGDASVTPKSNQDPPSIRPGISGILRHSGQDTTPQSTPKGGGSAKSSDTPKSRDSPTSARTSLPTSMGFSTPSSRFWRPPAARPDVKRSESDEDQELRSYKNMDHMDNDNEEIEFDLDDDPLSKALRYIRQQRDLLKSGNPEIIDEESRLKAWVEMDELTLLLKEEVIQKGVRRWVRFDLLFGLAICANGVFLGLTTQGIVDEEALWAKIVEFGFLTVFIIEWLLRWYHKPTGFCGMLADTWNLFDLILVSVSFVDLVILGLLDLKSGASLITALRVLRLFRLVRLVRLFRLLKKLWMLVSGMMESFRILGWSLLMLSLFCYIFGLFMLESIRSTNFLTTVPGADIRWGSVMGCMLSMAEIATHNGEALLKELAEEVGIWILGVILLFLFIASLGLLNLVVAVQMTSSLNLAKQDKQYEDLIQRLMRHRALRRLRELLNERCVSTTGSVFVTRTLLMKWVNDPLPAVSESDSTILESGVESSEVYASSGVGSRSTAADKIPSHATVLSKKLDPEDAERMAAFKSQMMEPSRAAQRTMTTSKFSEISDFLARKERRKVGIARDFQDAGITEDEIKMIFDEVDSVQGEKRSLPVDEFIDSCILLKGRVHELDFVRLSQSVHCSYWRLADIKSSLTQTARALEESSEQVRGLLRKYHQTGAAEKEGAQEDWQDDVLDEEDTEMKSPRPEDNQDEARGAAAKAEQDDRQKLVLRNEQEALLLTQEMNRLNEKQNWANFDFTFALVVLLNSVVFGIEAVSDTSTIERDIRSANFDALSTVWFVLDFFFLLMYALELFFRIVYHYQMEVQHDFRNVSGVLPKLAFVMDRRTTINVLKSFPRWLKRPSNFMLLDTLVVVLGIFDNFILRMMSGFDAGTRKFFQLRSLLRLLRLVRLLHLVRPLSVLLKAFLINSKLIMWSLVMLIIMIYAGSIAMVSLVGQVPGNQQDPIIHQKWGHIGSAMLTLSEMVLYTNWGTHIMEVRSQGVLITGGLLVFVGITSLGILNLVVGVMVQVAFYTVVGLNQATLSHKLSQVKGEVQEAIDRAVAKEMAKREKDKAELQMRVRKMRQEAVEVNIAMESKERQRLNRNGSYVVGGGSGGNTARLRRSVGKDMGTSEVLGLLGGNPNWDSEDEDQPRGASASYKKPQSFLNARNRCTVVHCFWTSEGELCIGISSVEESSRQGSSRGDMMHAALIWDGGRMNPMVWIPDEEVNAGNDTGVGRRHTQHPDKKETAKTEAASNTRTQGKRRHRGDLFFGKVPMGTDLYFQFAANYSNLRVYPVKSSMEWDSKILLADVLPVDKEVLTIDQLRDIMQDQKFIVQLGLIGLRPEQALMTYSTLNVVAIGKVRVVDFIDGLLRLRRQDVGLDTAGAKSLLRRLMLQVTQLSKDTVTCNMCFSNAVQKLHGISILEKEDVLREEDQVEMVDDDAVVLEHQGRLQKENEKFKLKLQRLTKYVAAKKEALGIKGDLGFGRAPIDEREDDEASCAMSITSASPGWD